MLLFERQTVEFKGVVFLISRLYPEITNRNCDLLVQGVVSCLQFYPISVTAVIPTGLFYKLSQLQNHLDYSCSIFCGI